MAALNKIAANSPSRQSPSELESSLANALFDLESNTQDLKASLRPLQFVSAREVGFYSQHELSYFGCVWVCQFGVRLKRLQVASSWGTVQRVMVYAKNQSACSRFRSNMNCTNYIAQPRKYNLGEFSLMLSDNRSRSAMARRLLPSSFPSLSSRVSTRSSSGMLCERHQTDRDNKTETDGPTD